MRLLLRDTDSRLDLKGREFIMTSGSPVSKPRDIRLDFFRGVALLLICIVHMPDNWLAEYRHGCFGFSDSADIFVFVSGYTAAIAYDRIFRRAGFLVGCARIVKRCGQLYAGHLGLFFSVALLCVAGNRLLSTDTDYIRLLNLGYFFEHPEDALYGLFTMTYVPNYFDILPMYFVVLAMLPLMVLLGRVHPMAPVALSIALYISVPAFGLELPAEIAFERPWFFNPFAWQFLFYTGFFLGLGTFKTPAQRAWLTGVCIFYLILSIPVSHYPTYSRIQWLENIRVQLGPLVSKTNLGILRWIHFMCLAYLMSKAFSAGREKVLQGWAGRLLIKAGEQALPVFLAGMALSQIAGMAMDILGRTVPRVLMVNAGAVVILIMTAYGIAWFKSQPWKSVPAPQRIAGEDRVTSWYPTRK